MVFRLARQRNSGLVGPFDAGRARLRQYPTAVWRKCCTRRAYHVQIHHLDHLDPKSAVLRCCAGFV